MFHIALYQPQIAPNTGNIIRLAANTGCHLHIVEPTGFDFEEKKLRRAGLDYHDLARVSRYPDYSAFLAAMGNRRLLAFTTKGATPYHKVKFLPDDVLLFGSETTGLPDDIREAFPTEHRLRLPMQEGSRSLNLANTVAVVCYEAWRQNGFPGGS
ncbi:MAG TPA: tRNA (cytidine(34)-2'-O)-methyltransferase [Pseudomonas xinjiangensis]|uniref:tRNA (cytidine(34)-2'-O)-methyltransferase n=2 Tax=root TaxID=1 RepID=A0A7V1FSN4_9GAMM|nr:tRNA (cytidine(34)-2'-O)-methyltransferase [Halopseudomonas xinjiangensis]HEC48385.1 tRNA (cytidine(34)-2'-O)-methyltransferase [Halopseudomonas xinjiangensis]